MTTKHWIMTASAVSATGVCLGAFGAHILKSKISTDDLEVFQKGIQYLFLHSIAILISAILNIQFPNKFFRQSNWFFLAGIILFSGSLFLISTHSITGLVNYQWIGPVTPMGGMCFITGWIFFLMGASKIQSKL